MKSIAVYGIKHTVFLIFSRGHRSGTLIEHGLNLSISYEITVCNSLTSSPRYRNQLNGSRYKMQNIIVFKKSFFHLSVENVTALYQNNSLKLKKEFLSYFLKISCTSALGLVLIFLTLINFTVVCISRA